MFDFLRKGDLPSDPNLLTKAQLEEIHQALHAGIKSLEDKKPMSANPEHHLKRNSRLLYLRSIIFNWRRAEHNYPGHERRR
jgi:hypothetical protein